MREAIELLQNLGLSCGASCACAEKLAGTLTDEQMHLLRKSASGGEHSLLELAFSAHPTPLQVQLVGKIVNTKHMIALGYAPSRVVILALPLFDSDDDEAMTPEILADNTARVLREKQESRR